MGQDEKLDYNPIKYLKCADLKSYGFSINDISDLMNESASQIKTWLEALEE